MKYQSQKDDVLLGLMRQSDARAFDEIYRRYWAVVFRYAVCKVHTQAIAEDLCQDVFVSLWQRRSALPIQNLEAFLVQAAKYGVLNHIRVKVQDRKHNSFAEAKVFSGNETKDRTALKALMEAWERAVSTLPQKTQEVFRLSKEQDYSNKEIASMLHLTEKTVEYHIGKSHKIIRLQLRHFGASSH